MTHPRHSITASGIQDPAQQARMAKPSHLMRSCLGRIARIPGEFQTQTRLGRPPLPSDRRARHRHTSLVCLLSISASRCASLQLDLRPDSLSASPATTTRAHSASHTVDRDAACGGRGTSLGLLPIRQSQPCRSRRSQASSIRFSCHYPTRPATSPCRPIALSVPRKSRGSSVPSRDGYPTRLRECAARRLCTDTWHPHLASRY